MTQQPDKSQGVPRAAAHHAITHVKYVCRTAGCDSEIVWDVDGWVCLESRHFNRRPGPAKATSRPGADR